MKDKDFAEAFRDAIADAFGRVANVRPHNTIYWIVRVGNKRGTFDGCRSFEPATDEERAAWLRGLWDSEGTAHLANVNGAVRPYTHRKVSLVSTNLDTLQRAAEMFETLGIKTRRRSVKLDASHRGTKPVYELAVCGREGFERFEAVIGTTIARKRAVLAQITASYQDDGWQREAQLRGAAAKRKRTEETVLPVVLRQIKEMLDVGVKPTFRACASIPGYHAVRNRTPHARLITLAQELPSCV